MSVRATKALTLSPGEVLKVTSARGEAFDVTIVRPLGATRTVFLGRRESTSDAVVLKIPRGRPGIEDRIEREITAQFDHPNLVRLLGTAVVGGRAILVLPKLGPNPLLLLNERQVRSRLGRDPGTKYYPLPPNVAIELLAELLRGLEQLHAAGFAHNDVKISNLLIDTGVPLSGVRSLEAVAQGRYRGVLIDLGAARSLAFLEDARNGAIDTDFVPPQLTPAYASPEVLTTQGRPAFGPAADIYAAGLTAYALYSGHYPYDHLDPVPTFADFADVAALKGRERRGEVSPCDLVGLEWVPYHDIEIMARETTREAIEGSFRDLLRRMVAADPAKRPTAGKALAELEWIFQLDARRGKGSVPACTVLRLRSENRFAEALTNLQAQAQGGSAEVPSASWEHLRSAPEPSSSLPPEDSERAWSRSANPNGEVSAETLMRYALRAVEGLVAASEPPKPPAPAPEQVEYDALIKVIGAALGSGMPAPELPPAPDPNQGSGVGDLMAWHRGEQEAGLADQNPYSQNAPWAAPQVAPGVPGSGKYATATSPGPAPTPSTGTPITTGGSQLPRGQALSPSGVTGAFAGVHAAAGVAPSQPEGEVPELREMKRAELFTPRDVWLAAALARAGLLGPELIAEALAAHVTARRPLAAILRERYLNTEVVEALRVLARALALQPHEI